jgi:phosphoesterase RecJ-like protein
MSRSDVDTMAAVERLRSATRALVTCHRRPDGDALGSELALALLAEQLGVETVIVNRDVTPTSLSELPGVERVLVAARLPEGFPDGFELVVTLECPELDRAGFDNLDRLPILNIDHHPANLRFGDVNFVDETSPAVGEMMWRMFRAAGVAPSPEAATNTYLALSTDTGDFRYSNATNRAFLAAAEMVESGADPTRVADWVHGRRSAAAIRLLGEALQSLTLEAGGRLATIELDEAAFARCEASPADSEDIINHPRSIAGVQAVVFLKQWEPGVVRVSLRSKGDVDVRGVAARFGGGGHANAAGCTLNGDLATARDSIIKVIAEDLEREP